MLLGGSRGGMVAAWGSKEVQARFFLGLGKHSKKEAGREDRRMILSS
jgi:hypothetical protein